MAKNRQLLRGGVLLLAILLPFLFACSHDSGGDNGYEQPSGDNDSQGQSIDGLISIEKFDSLLRSLSVDADFPDGTELTATANGESATGKVSQKKVSFNLAASFPETIEGGTNYNAVISTNASGYTGSKTLSLFYTPVVRLKFLTDEEEIIFNGDANYYTPPKVYINYVSMDAVDWNQWFTVYKLAEGSDEAGDDDTDITESVGANSWTKMENMLDYLSDVSNDGTYVKVHFTVLPKGITDTTYAADGYITFYCKKDTLITKVTASYKYDYIEALTTDENGDEAGGIVTYQWQISDDGEHFTDIAGATSKKYTVQKTDWEKQLRVKIKQNFEGTEQDEIVSEAVLAEGLISDAKISYDGIVTEGGQFSVSNVSGYLVDSLGEKISLSDCTVSLKNNDGSLTYSLEVPLTITASGYHAYEDAVFVLVKKAAPTGDELNLLSTDSATIGYGHVKFSGTNAGLAWSRDGGTTWNEITTDEMDAALGEVFLVRKKAEGTPNSQGYVMESDAAPVTVKTENIGIKAEGGISIDTKNLAFSIEKTTSGTVVTYTPVIENYDVVYGDSCKIEATWRIDGVLAENFDGVTLRGTSLVIDTADFAADTYQISVVEKVLVDLSFNDESEWKEVTKFAAQTTLEVK